MRRPLLVLGVALALALVACSGSETPRGVDRPAASPAPAPARADAAAEPAPLTRTTPAEDERLTLAFGGDVHFDEQLAPRLADPQEALAELRPYLAGADLAVVNLESALTGRGSPAPKRYHFRAPPAALTALAAAGVDVVTMANNHAVDYGADGFADTLAARRTSPIPVVGIGRDRADALRPAVERASGRRVAVLGATQVPDWTASAWAASPTSGGVALSRPSRDLVAAVRAARTAADVVVVYLHWGTDYTACPDDAQRDTARELADAGADVVVGTHAHRVQGAGWLGDTYVAYGLGNFVWAGRNGEPDTRTGVLTLTVEGRRTTSARWTPLRVQADGVPRLPGAAEAQRMQAQWQSARGCTGLAGTPG